MELERPGVVERLLEAVRDGIDAARFFARHETVSGMTDDDIRLVELANAVEEAAANLDDAMMSLIEHHDDDPEPEPEPFDEKAN